MKKVFSIVMAVCMIAISVFAFGGCAKQDKLSYDVVLVTDGKSINDGGYNQSAWDGVKEYAEENNMTYRYYQPNSDYDKKENPDAVATTETIEKFIDLAVEKGAKYVVCPGETLAVPVYETASSYKDVKFVLLDAVPHSEGDPTYHNLSNVMCISFSALESGFLAGYESVKAGITQLGYIGEIANDESGCYGAGYAQGAAYAADELNIPVTMKYANIDSPVLGFDYTLNVKAVYKKISGDKIHTVTVKNGTGTGSYAIGATVGISADAAKDGKVFDHWECKSDSKDVKDKEISLTSSTKVNSSVIVTKGDCTITAVYKDAENPTHKLEVTGEGSGYYQEGAKSDIVAQPAEQGKVFDCWKVTGDAQVDDEHSSSTTAKMGSKDSTITAVYKDSEEHTFKLNVEGGSGSGYYVQGDKVRIIADAPKDGYMFAKWELTDANGYSTNVELENELYYDTTFDMPNRFTALAESMYNSGIDCIYTGGNTEYKAIFDATGNYSYQVWGFGADIDCKDEKGCIGSTVKDMRVAVKAAIKDFNGGTITEASCDDEGIYMTNVGDKFDEKDYKAIYKKIADGKIKLVAAESGADLTQTVKGYKCFSLTSMDVIQ